MEQSAALRAEWLAQLAEVIEGAQRLAWQLGGSQSTAAEARNLYDRLEEARVEINSLQGLREATARDIEPEWLRKLGWGRPRIDFDRHP